jgi:hypothetical protein
VSERRDHYVRYGLAFILEHGFMRTEKGRMCYKMNLEQIRNAILETAYIGVLEAYLACKNPGILSSMKWRYQLHGSRLGSALAQEIEDFACIQKIEHGFDLLDSRAKRFLRGMSIKPDMWILPEGVKIYLTNVRKENFDYLIAGPNGQVRRAGPRGARSVRPQAGRLLARCARSLTPALACFEVYKCELVLRGSRGRLRPLQDVFQSRGAAVDKANDCMIFEAKQFEIPNEPRPIDVLQRRAVIGEYYFMQNHLRGAVKPEDYRSSMRDVFVYNEVRVASQPLNPPHPLCVFFGEGLKGAARPLAGQGWL